MYCKNLCLLFAVSAFILVCLSMASSNPTKVRKDVCNKKRLCKYGGKCGTSGTCRCNFDCNPMLWETTLYCGPKQKDGKTRKYFLNLCQVLAYACELQKDVPIVKLNLNSGLCEDHISPSTKFCTHPKDYMGPCGGSNSFDGNIEAGICLEEIHKGARHCLCPSSRDGKDCQKRRRVTSLPLPNHKPGEDHDLEQKFKFSPEILIFAVVCFAVFVALSCLVILRYKALTRRLIQSNHGSAQRGTPSMKDTCAEKLHDASMLTSISCEKPAQENQTASFLCGKKSCNKVDSVLMHHPGTQQRLRLSGYSFSSTECGLALEHSNLSAEEERHTVLSDLKCNNNNNDIQK